MCRKKNLLFLLVVLSTVGFGDLRSAADSIKQEIEINPDNFKLHFDLGLCYMTLEENENALEAFKRASELKPDHVLTRYKIAQVYYFLDSLEAARNKLEELKKSYPNSETAYGFLGEIYALLGDFDNMRRTYHEYEDITNDYQFNFYFARPCAFLGNYDEAIQYYLEIIEHNKYAYVACRHVAMLYARMGDTLNARTWIEKSIAMMCQFADDKTTKLSYTAISSYYVADFDKAIRNMDVLINKGTRNSIDYWNRGNLRIASGDFEGMSDIRKACQFDTTGFVRTVYNALAAIKIDSIVEAESLLQQGVVRSYRSGIATGLLAWTLEQLGRSAEAKKYWYRCYCRLPLGTDAASMRNFIDNYVNTIEFEP